MIHTTIAFFGNITKIASPMIELTLYLHIINKPLTPILLIYIYMSTNVEDLHVIPLLQQTIKQTIDNLTTCYPMLIGDFNRDILLIGRQTSLATSPPSHWHTFVEEMQLTPIPNTINFSRQGSPQLDNRVIQYMP